MWTSTDPTPSAVHWPVGSRITAVASSTATRATSAGASEMVRRTRSLDHVDAAGSTATSSIRARPIVKAPPRGSIIGSPRIIAPAPDPATTAPSSHAWSRACHTLDCLSTERTCMGEPSAR
jgi:hypothetical protein